MKLFIGVDVSKNSLDIYCNGITSQVSNNRAGLTKLYKVLQKEVKGGNEIELIVCEATGGYENKLVYFSVEKNMPIHVAHANKVRHYAEAEGILAKTDKIDACLLAKYGETMKVKAINRLPTAEEKELIGLLKRREQLKADKVREKVRLDKDLNPMARKSINSHIKWLEKEIAMIDAELKQLEENDFIKTKVDLLKSVPGIGDISAYTLIAFLPELGSIAKAKKVVALSGLAPFCKDSGKHRGKRYIQGGRADVRKALYMAALSSVRHYKEMQDFYERLRSKGKLAKVALIAVARKLLSVVNSVMWRQTAWQETYPVVAVNKNF